ncbi:hypothetical protein T4B_11349 [Trichinella pseudospiralis]|uniref:Uncharacterized protein n=1 Tax=Trichinella pseudospiralis TaxID=6337 RepID=A0A0V1H132_TRIPS|nr:hypothetical protein T4A_4427 [Trichinella pseudospiralis]KRZ04256.1 hypothetical protein T4B_11349 [Trichinella pseudospiralis]KRZ24806.1 hypothetical protein T4C_13801 [Trichinella pseudospiralis]
MCWGEKMSSSARSLTIVRGRSLILASISQSTVRCSSGPALLRPRTFVSATFTILTSRSQYPPHHGVMNLHSMCSSARVR